MSTCRDCHKSWTGLSAGHCTVCHETFSSASNDRHWTKDGHIHPSPVLFVWCVCVRFSVIRENVCEGKIGVCEGKRGEKRGGG